MDRWVLNGLEHTNGPIGVIRTKNRDGDSREPSLCVGSRRCFQELSSTRLVFWSAVCWLLGRLWRVRTMCSGVTGLLLQPERGWMCGTVLSVGISFMSTARSLWILVCGIQRGVETGAWPFNKIPNLFIFLSWQGLSAIMPVAMALSVEQKSYGINRFLYILTFAIDNLF